MSEMTINYKKIFFNKKIMSCDNCNTIILFGGIKEKGLHFCSKNCYNEGYYKVLSKDISDDQIDDLVNETFYNKCLECGNTGYNNLYFSYKIFSFIFATSWKDEPHICCKKCAKKYQLKALVYSLFLGWWGFPWGLTTPITIIKNIYFILKDEETTPNDKLKQHFKEIVAINIINNDNQN